MEIVSTIAMISINATLVVQLLSFLLFLLIINRIMFRPLRNTMRERDFFIENLTREIDGANREYDQVLADLDQQEQQVRQAANELRRQRRDEGAGEARAIVDEAVGYIGALNLQAREDVDRQMAEARKALTMEAEGVAVALMEKILKRRIGS
jgi:F-type H+-transporting ATPase subunit b